jgi:hypothetical protein
MTLICYLRGVCFYGAKTWPDARPVAYEDLPAHTAFSSGPSSKATDVVPDSSLGSVNSTGGFPKRCPISVLEHQPRCCHAGGAKMLSCIITAALSRAE